MPRQAAGYPRLFGRLCALAEACGRLSPCRQMLLVKYRRRLQQQRAIGRAAEQEASTFQPLENAALALCVIAPLDFTFVNTSSGC